jgi:regulator of protease activity HflC (stomatin/prohibitin superfamily)
MIRERENRGVSGLPVLLVLIGISGLCTWGVVDAARDESVLAIVGFAVALLLALFLMAGVFVVNPNEGRVLQLFGDYRGTARVAGLRWANPFYTKKRISLRVRNFESARLKVNDIEGNPIEIAAVVVWQVVDTAEAVFEVR